MTPRCCGKDMARMTEALGYVCSECRRFVVYEAPETQLEVRSMTSDERRQHTEFLRSIGRPF